MSQRLIQAHGGYRKLKSFQLARLVYDLTERFCDRFVSRFSRTHDQMIQAARSGVQNIAEGSRASATSKKSELKLTNVARGSLEELLLDYEDFLRHKHYSFWEYDDVRRNELIACRFTTIDQVSKWINEMHVQNRGHISEIAANAIIVLIKVVCQLLTRQIEAQAKAFEQNGGFTERLYHISKNRQNDVK